jgi:hypothetical protein
MPDVPKHAWTHRSKALGGTDPLTIPALIPVPAAIMTEGMTSRSTGSKLYMTMGGFYTNDTTVFGYSDVTSTKAKFLTISENGVYRAEGVMLWNSDFTAGDQPRVVFSTNQGSVDGDLVPGLDVYFETEAGIWNEQISADDMDHWKLWISAVFNVDLALWGETPLKLGLALYSNNSRTKNFGAQLAVYRVSTELMTEVTIT